MRFIPENFITYDYNQTYLCDISNTFIVSDLEKARHIVAWWEKEKKGTGYINRPGYTGTTKSRFKRLCGKTSWIQDKHLQPKSATDPTQSEKEHIVKGRRIQRPPQFTESVMFVPYTVKGELAKKIERGRERAEIEDSGEGRK